MTKFGIVTFENNQQMICCYDNAKNIKTFAAEHLKSIMEDEGFQLNDMAGYLEGWREAISEIREDNGDDEITDVNDILDEIASQVTYTNVHLVLSIEGNDWVSINSTHKDTFYDAIIEILERGQFLGTDKQEKFLNDIEGTQFKKDLLKPMGGALSKGTYNLIISIRDCKFWLRGMKPHRHWKVSQVKAYFGIKGNKEKLVETLEEYNSILQNK